MKTYIFNLILLFFSISFFQNSWGIDLSNQRQGKHGYLLGFELELHNKHLEPFANQIGIHGINLEDIRLSTLMGEINLYTPRALNKIQILAEAFSLGKASNVTHQNKYQFFDHIQKQFGNLLWSNIPKIVKTIYFESYQTQIYPLKNAVPELKEFFYLSQLENEQTASVEFAVKKEKLYKKPEDYIRELEKFIKLFNLEKEFNSPLSPDRLASLHLHLSRNKIINNESLIILRDYKLFKILESEHFSSFLTGHPSIQDTRDQKNVGESRTTVNWFGFGPSGKENESINRRAVNHFEDKILVESPREQLNLILEVLESTDLTKTKKTLYKKMIDRFSPSIIKQILVRLHYNTRSNKEHYSVKFLLRLYKHTQSELLVSHISSAIETLSNSKSVFRMNHVNELVYMASETSDIKLINKIFTKLLNRNSTIFNSHFFDYSGADPKMKLLSEELILEILKKHYSSGERKKDLPDILHHLEEKSKMKRIKEKLNSINLCTKGF